MLRIWGAKDLGARSYQGVENCKLSLNSSEKEKPAAAFVNKRPPAMDRTWPCAAHRNACATAQRREARVISYHTKRSPWWWPRDLMPDPDRSRLQLQRTSTRGWSVLWRRERHRRDEPVINAIRPPQGHSGTALHAPLCHLPCCLLLWSPSPRLLLLQLSSSSSSCTAARLKFRGVCSASLLQDWKSSRACVDFWESRCSWRVDFGMQSHRIGPAQWIIDASLFWPRNPTLSSGQSEWLMNSSVFLLKKWLH